MEASTLTRAQRKVSENPFYKMGSTLNLFQQGNKLSNTSTKEEVYKYLDAAWNECKVDQVKKELFFILLFSLGDIANREHNIFRKKGITKVDQGGQSKRWVFASCIEWMVERVPQQFYAFMPIIGEYYNLDGLMLYELKTDRWKGTLQKVVKIPVDIDIVTTYIASVLRNTHTTENDKAIWARWLPHVPIHDYRTRTYNITEKNIKAFQKQGHNDIKITDVVKVRKPKKQHTLDKDSWTHNFIRLLSEKMDWKVFKKGKGNKYIGYTQFRTKYLSGTEAVLFSTGKIKAFDKTQFFEWMDKLPSGARFRVACRLAGKDKSGNLTPGTKWFLNTGENMGELYIDWIKSKQKAQTKLASMTTAEKKEMAPTELKQLEKAAKVNTGGETILDLIADLISRRHSASELDVKAFSLLKKIEIGVPVFTIVDISGSMGTAGMNHNNVSLTATALCRIAATLFMLKNPAEEMQDLFMRFGSHAEVMYAGARAEIAGANRFNTAQTVLVDKITDRTKPFLWNLDNVSKLIGNTHGSTNFEKVASTLKAWVDQDPALKSQRIDWINMYPVFLAISDGEFNGMGSASRTFQEFQQNMRQWFGWEGVLVLWDVKASTYGDQMKFDGSNNIMYFGGMNIGIVDQIFKNIHDLDVIDQYLPLKALHNSNRYSPVRELVQ